MIKTFYNHRNGRRFQIDVLCSYEVHVEHATYTVQLAINHDALGEMQVVHPANGARIQTITPEMLTSAGGVARLAVQRAVHLVASRERTFHQVMQSQG